MYRNQYIFWLPVEIWGSRRRIQGTGLPAILLSSPKLIALQLNSSIRIPLKILVWIFEKIDNYLSISNDLNKIFNLRVVGSVLIKNPLLIFPYPFAYKILPKFCCFEHYRDKATLRGELYFTLGHSETGLYRQVAFGEGLTAGYQVWRQCAFKFVATLLKPSMPEDLLLIYLSGPIWHIWNYSEPMVHLKLSSVLSKNSQKI